MDFNPIQTKLGVPSYNEYFPSIVYQNAFPEDNTLVSVARAEMNEERLATFTAKPGKEGKMQIQVLNKEFYLTGDTKKIDANYYGGDHGPFKQSILGLWMFFISNANASEHIKEIKNFDDAYKKLGWTRLEDVSLYLEPAEDVLCYQNEKNQATIVFAPTTKKIRVMQMAASCLPRILPWAFKDHPLTEDEASVLKMLSEQDYKGFEAAIDKIHEAYNFYGKKVQQLLKGFCSQNFQRLIADREREVEQAEREVNDRYRRVHEAENILDDKRMRLLTLRNSACNSDESEKELLEFFSTNKSLTLLKKSGRTLYLGVNCYLNDCNEDIFKQYVEKQDKMSSYIYEQSPFGMEYTKALFLSIWKEHRFNLRVYCEWILNDNGGVDAVRDSSMEGNDDMMKDRIPQPHIDRYQCFGGYQGILNDLARSRDYIGILSTILTSSSYINWTDSTVVDKLMQWMFKTKADVKCLEDKDGNRYTVSEVIDILKKEKEEKAA